MRIMPAFVLLTVLVWCGTSAAPAAASVAATKTTVKQTGKAQSSKPRATAKSSPRTVKYKVRQGDSLYIIARNHGMKVAKLRDLNALSSDRIRPGQTLKVYASAGGGGKRQKELEAIPRPDTVLLAETSETTPGEVGIEPIARSYLSIPYRWGAESRRSTDCSGFTQQVFREFSIDLPRTAREQYTVGQAIDKDGLKSGDLLFFRSKKKKYPTHVGIYLGGGKMIHASRSHHKVIVSDANHPYFVSRYLGAKRMANFLSGELDLELLAQQVGAFDNALAADEAEGKTDAGQVTATTICSEAVSGTGGQQPDDDAAATGDETGDDVENEGDAEPEPLAVPTAPRIGAVTPEVPAAALAEPNGEVTTVAAVGSGGEPQ